MKLFQWCFQGVFVSFRFNHSMVNEVSITRERTLDMENDRIREVTAPILLRCDNVPSGYWEVVTEDSRCHCFHEVFRRWVLFDESNELIEDWDGKIYDWFCNMIAKWMRDESYGLLLSFFLFSKKPASDTCIVIEGAELDIWDRPPS
jgi:hypothetical protein